MAAQGNTKVIYAALFANGAIAVTKFIASAVTGSSAMFAEGVHSVVDTGNQFLLLFGIRRSKRPASAEHPFGHGKDLYFYAFMVAIMIFGAGAGFAGYEGIHKLLEPTEVSPSWINYAVLGIAFVFEAVAWTMAYRGFQASRRGRGIIETVHRSKDPTLFTVLFEDTAAMLGLIIAFFGVLATQLTGDPVYDALATCFIAVVLAVTAVFLAIETKGLLVGEAADPNVVRQLRATVTADPAVVAVGDVLTMHLGPNEILATISADFDNSISAGSVEDATARLRKTVQASFPDVSRLYIEARELKPGTASV
ncbi:cation diffusion facilitator family transporter [Acuticoccus sp. I52.16.1]|uniref:cation diffusion facilitator family transporter n=1 Tax=Acuticoccus sp. I52.16.1 TaxID=2928472 RepID=UPI001FD14D79|nr:cation diffusion facilitator family transporter [Acuticoccus sp. I52.16.1]UOM35525.1 cation diffusion facilitator family transporter [Acuticoccus sp. I52.16.1]